jgi:hypothetical protein
MVPHLHPEPREVRESPFLYRVGVAWEAVKDYWDVLRPMRFCVFVWIAITLLICLVPQSSDALLSLSENLFAAPPDIVSIFVMLLFAATVFFWSFESFYWARFMSRLPARARRQTCYVPPYFDDSAIETLNEESPRRLGYLVLASVWLALLIANRGLTLTSFGYEMFATVMMTTLMFAYRASVHGRRDIATAVHAKVRLASFAVDSRFFRDLHGIALRGEVKIILGCLTLLSLGIYLASGFVRLWPWLPLRAWWSG